MAMKRYTRAPLLDLGRAIGTSDRMTAIYQAAQLGRIKTKRAVLKQSDRLDNIAGRQYGNARLWWVIAAASGIGWSLQVPPGTSLKIPTDLGEIAALVS